MFDNYSLTSKFSLISNKYINYSNWCSIANYYILKYIIHLRKLHQDESYIVDHAIFSFLCFKLLPYLHIFDVVLLERNND